MAAQCACLNMRKVSRAVTQYYDEVLEPSGLRSTQLAVLVSIATHDSPSLTDLGDILVMDPSTVSRTVRPLQARGLIAMSRGTDRRRRAVTITDARQALIDETVPLWRQAQDRLVSELGPGVWSGMRLGLMHALAIVRDMDAAE